MKLQISDVERRILAVLQHGFPRSRTPYQDMAERTGITTEQLFVVLDNWRRQGKLRRIGAIVDHFKVGLSTGAMVAWQVEPERIEQVGMILADFKQVSHAYQRNTRENWPYSMYTMIHGKDIQEVEQTIQRMSRACGVSDYRILFTEKELKKVSPTYI